MKSSLLFAGCLLWFGACARVSIANQPLFITNNAGEVTISWPVTGDTWTLEGSPVLPPAANWIGVIPMFDQTNGVIRRTRIASADTNRFFRLRRLDAGVPGLTGRWQLDEGTGQVAHDGSGAGATLFINGANWTSGRIGVGALQFNGNGGTSGSRCWVSNINYQVLPGPAQPFSVSFWFNPDVLTTGWRGLAGTDANGSNGWHVALLTTGPGTNYLVFAGSASQSSLNVTGRTLLLPRQWYQLTVTHDGSVGSVYLDGVRLASGAGTIPAHKGPVYFGGGVGGYNSFLGRIDDVRTFTNCLTDERIVLAGEWHFDEGLGNFTGDSSGRTHHATLTDPAAWAAGREGGGIDLSRGQVTIPNDDLTVLPPSGKPFSVSFWLRPGVVAPGRFGLLHHGIDGLNGWQMAVVIGESGQADLQLSSTNRDGTLDLTARVPFAAGVWAKLDVTFNGAIATVYCDGRKVSTGSGAVRASRAPIVIGRVPGLANFPGMVDELRIHSREKGEADVGPVAPVMWETVLMNTVTNFPLRGSGPAGRPLVYTIVPIIVPTNGTVTLTAGTSATYAAGARKGPDAFTYIVSDGEFTSAPSIFRVSVVEPHWLSPTGGAGASQDGRSPSTAWEAGTARKLDAIWKTNSFYDCFFYAPGEYQTKGWKYYERATVNPGCKHVGSGSEGPKTIIKLVDIWEAHGEALIFAPLFGGQTTDDFEIHRMVLDCNAANLPKYVTGEPVWIRVPLNSAGRVDSVSLHWGTGTVPGTPIHRFGGPARFTVQALRSGAVAFVTNCVSGGPVDNVFLGTDADELLLQLEMRGARVDYYALKQFEVAGAAVCLPSATVPGSGNSRLDIAHAISFATDGDLSTSWASGAESEARIIIPMASGSEINRVKLTWNCETLAGFGRLGPAETYSVQARDELTGEYHDVPFTRSSRDADGTETVSIGAGASAITTDRLALVLTVREPSVNYYSLREVTIWNGPAPVLIRQPTSLNKLGSIAFPISRAFDSDSDTQWASGTQGTVSAINLTGSNLKFSDLLIVGFGTKAGAECFPMGIVTHSVPIPVPPRHGNVLIENCRFADPATNNTDGLTALTMIGNQYVSLTNAVARGCIVTDLRPYFAYSQGISATHIVNCLVSNCAGAVYFEPDRAAWDSVGAVLIQSNQFLDVDFGVLVKSHPGARFDSITCLDNEIVLSGKVPFQLGIGACDVCYGGPNGVITNLAALNNIIRYADWGARPAGPDLGLHYSDIHHAIFANNLIALGTPGALRVRGCPSGTTPADPPVEDCDHYDPTPPGPPTPIPCLDSLLPGHRRAWLNNRDQAGQLLQTRIISNGVDVPALEQQWPE